MLKPQRTPSKRLAKRVAPPPARSEPAPKRRNKVRVARVVIYERHAEMTMLGFELEDLAALKDSVAMRWDKSDKCWIIDRRDLKYLLTALEDNSFIVRIKHLDDE